MPYGIAGGAAQAAITPTRSGQYTTSSVPPVQVAAPVAAERKPRPKAKPKAKPKGKGKGGVPGINQYLAGDTTYQDQASQLQKQLEDFNLSNTNQQGMVNQDFGSAAGKMALQKQQDQRNMQGDFASRGMLNSGLFTKAVGDYDTNYQNQYNDLATGQSRSLADLLESLQNYTTENRSSLVSAKQDAIRRRAQKYGITV